MVDFENETLYYYKYLDLLRESGRYNILRLYNRIKFMNMFPLHSDNFYREITLNNIPNRQLP